MVKRLGFGFNQAGYTILCVLTLIYFFGMKDPGMAMASSGLALAFDPFDPAVRWNDRPVWQRAWLIVHLAVTGLLSVSLFF